jgi:uncharacterized membrane protein
VSVALGIQQAMRMRNFVIFGLYGSTIFFFLHYLINDRNFGKSYRTQNIYFDFLLQLLSEIFIILRIPQRDVFINVHKSSGKVPCSINV